EPATGSSDPLAMRFDRGRDSHERWHNQYALLMAMGTTEGLRAARPDRRTFVLSRAGFAGIQRYAANWMGDNLSRWDHLRLSVAMACGLGLSGQPFVGADVGGFMGNANAELCVRWTQYGALTPFFRNHSGIGNVDQYAWSWGASAETQIRAAIELRYRLLPYLYGAFLESSRTGAPVQRPLVFDHQDDATVLDLDDEYLLGRDLLVAPVTEPGMTARQVYLPSGGWVDWYDDTLLAGGRFVIASTPMDRIPLYARAGSVVPMWPEAPASTSGHRPRTLELHVFVPDVDGTHVSEVQEDDGLSLDAQNGAFVRTTVRLSRVGDRLTVEATVDGDGYDDFARTGVRLVLHGARARTAWLDGEPVQLASGGAEIAVEVPHTHDFTWEAVLA
ncbi:MAG TPA: TIM-barrel domain-containing protein, partial [Nocardioides sp.]|nr:TIM-barrel domain-containing protein [Nocardioides sp.]